MSPNNSPQADRKLDQILGPQPSANEYAAHRARYLLPTLFFTAAAILLVISIFLPWWRLTLQAPQYPKGLTVIAYVNHYIGMRPLNEAAEFERSIAIIGIAGLALLILAAVFVHRRWVVLLTLPAIFLPVLFLADLQWWLANFGTNLDPTAALSSSIEPFVPPVLGKGTIAQFSTIARPDIGMWLAIVASGLILVGLYFHRRAWKPLVDAQ
jgi:hypothetical protein